MTFDAVLVPAGLRAAVSDRAWLEAMLDAERALANAEAIAGVIPAHVAGPIADACRAELFDAGEVAAAGRWAGNPAEPLVRALRERSAARPRPSSTTAQRARTSSTPLRCSSPRGRSG